LPHFDEEAPMSAALAEPLDAVATAHTDSTTHIRTSTARAEASRANGRLSRGPVTPEGKARSRRNGCKDGLTGAGVVLPPSAAADVEHREAEFANDFRPRTAVERELVRQMALASWRSHELSLRIIQHDTRITAARWANWEQDEQIAAAELGRRLGDDPEAVVAQLQRSSTGCNWLIERWRLLDGAVVGPEEGGPVCAWTDADLALALNLLARPVELRHLDGDTRRLEALRDQAHSGSEEAVAELREIIAGKVAALEKRSEEIWEEVEQPLLRDLHAGAMIDLGVEGTRLRRYEAAADRLFRSAWTKLERLRNERGEPLITRSASAAGPEPATLPSAASGPAVSTAARYVQEVLGRLQRDDAVDARLDLWACGPPRNGVHREHSPQNKANPTRPTHDGRSTP
jgi:hypothetical protein